MAMRRERPAIDVLPMLVDAAGALEVRAGALAEQARRRPLAMLVAAVALGYLAGLAARATAAYRV
jgi:hypothetical protein